MTGADNPDRPFVPSPVFKKWENEKKVKKTILPMNWQNFDDYCNILAKKIKASKIKFKNIYGEPRGGLVVAVKLSHLLDIPLITNSIFANKRTLYVDDVVDSGKTLQYARLYWKVAVLFWNPNALFEPTFYVSSKIPDSWIVFPWEKNKKPIIALLTTPFFTSEDGKK